MGRYSEQIPGKTVLVTVLLDGLAEELEKLKWKEPVVTWHLYPAFAGWISTEVIGQKGMRSLLLSDTSQERRRGEGASQSRFGVATGNRSRLFF